MTTAIAHDLDRVLKGSPYVAYSYAYPHKTAYRALPEPLPLKDAWQEERQDSLFLYLHVPFCEYRCGFCNLFTLSQPEESLPRRYLEALAREAAANRAALEQPRFTRMAIGGGTPTFLSMDELDELFRLAENLLGAAPREISVSCEASPATLTAEKLALLRERGVDRLSLGIQSFNPRDAHAMGRPQASRDVQRALTVLRDADFATINLDLIYGGSTQTRASWLATVDEAIAFGPQEVYLYPLYVRPLTGLARFASWDDQRLALYRAGRDRLLEKGYQQRSMRMFSRGSPVEGPAYCCQDDGMIGLGCGARSYTRSLHYSREYAVRSGSVAGILASYIGRSDREFEYVEHGFELNADERRRRVLILSLLQASGLERAHYRRRFRRDVLDDFPQLLRLAERGLAEIDCRRLQLTASGLERSDAIGPWLYSAAVRRRTEEFQWR
ncbi:MAG: STM4012 family radical SAM protein [Planctomycetes bacterium]|nr:STM4012 family radical SAM protein [Planctomycetota bacterium]